MVHPQDLTVEDAVARLGASVLAVHGSRDIRFSRPMPIQIAEPGTITFCRKGHPNSETLVRETRASAVLCGPELVTLKAQVPDKVLVVVEDPRLSFLRLVQT